MRIIAGTHRGRRFAAPRGTHVRPTGDRVREALFSIVGAVDGAAVLDLFAGSGSLGLEALSRGARTCTFVERDRAAARAIRENLATLQLDGGRVLQRDAIQALREDAAAGRRYDLVLLDPPYDAWDGLASRLATTLPPVLEADALVVVETGERVEPALGLDLVTTRRYGSARLTVFRP